MSALMEQSFFSTGSTTSIHDHDGDDEDEEETMTSNTTTTSLGTSTTATDNYHRNDCGASSGTIGEHIDANISSSNNYNGNVDNRQQRQLPQKQALDVKGGDNAEQAAAAFEGDEEVEDFIPPPSSWYHHEQPGEQQLHKSSIYDQHAPATVMMNSRVSENLAITQQHILLPAYTGTSPDIDPLRSSLPLSATVSPTRVDGGGGGDVVTYPSPSWKELSSQVLPAAARELLSSSLRRIYHTARLSYSRDIRWHRRYSDMGHNAGGFSISSSSDLDLPPTYQDRLLFHGQQRQLQSDDSTNTRSSSNGYSNNSVRSTAASSTSTHRPQNHQQDNGQYIPPFSSLNWVDRQLVKEWRTYYLPESSRDRDPDRDRDGDNRGENMKTRRTHSTSIKDERTDHRQRTSTTTTATSATHGPETKRQNEENELKAQQQLGMHDPMYVDRKTETKTIPRFAEDRHDHDDSVNEDDGDDDPTLLFPCRDEEEFDFERARTLVPNPLPRPTWQKTDVCWECRKAFGPTRLRHHCRFCGKSFCQTHSSFSHRLPHLGYDPNVPERVCDSCYTMLEEQDLAERVAWRLARCRDYSVNQLTPYFETGVDSAEDIAIRVTRAAIEFAKALPLGAQATVAVETVDVLRKYGLHGIYGIMLRQEFLAAADLLRKALGINKTSWPLSVHELSAAIFYALAQHRAMRGLNPEREHIIHALRPSSAERVNSKPAIGECEKNRPSHVAAWTRTTSIPADSITTRSVVNDSDNLCTGKPEAGPESFPFEKYALSFHDENPILDQTDVYDPDFTTVDSFQHELTNACNLEERFRGKESGFTKSHNRTQPPKSMPTKFTPVCDPVPDHSLSSLIFYAPIALHFIYAEKEVEMQLLAAQQGWRLLYASLQQDLESVKPSDMPASAVFIHEEYKILCLSIRGTATINDVITDIRQTPVPFPDEMDLDNEQNASDGDWTSIFHGQGLALCGMASAAINLFREHIDSILFFAKKSYRIRLVGHSLGGGVATLIGILILKELERFSDTNTLSVHTTLEQHGASEEATQKLRVYAYGTPSCVDSKLADSVNSFVTTVVLHDDVFPRLTPTSCRGLLKHLLHIRETWVKVHMEEDLRAVGERAATAWAPRLRHNFTLGSSSSSIKKYCKKKIQIGKKKLVSSFTDKAQEGITSARNFIFEPECDSKSSDAKKSEPQMLLEFLGRGEKEKGGLVIDGDEFFETHESLVEDADESSEGSLNIGDSWSSDLHASSYDSPARSLGSDDRLEKNGTAAVVLDENPLPRMFVPGKVVHIYSHRGVYKATYVPRHFRELRKISMAGNMLSNHTTKSYFEGLLEVQTARKAPEAPPRWSAFDEDDTCNCCRNHFTWASTSNSQAQEARDKHNCRSCGVLVCDPCAKNRAPIPSIGLTVPVRVCDRCYHDIMGGVSAASSSMTSMTSSFLAIDEDDHTLSDTSLGRPGHDGTDDESGRPERRRQKRNMVVDDLVAQMKSSALTQMY